MKYVCQRRNCYKLISENKAIRMPFCGDVEIWCKECYEKWENGE